MVIRGVSGIFLGVSLFQAFRSWGQRRTPETGHLEVRTIFPTLLPSPLQQRFHLVFYTDEQLQLIDISSNHNLPSVLFEFMYPAACYHLRPSPCLFSKMCPPLVVSVETVGGAYLQTLEKQDKTNNSSKLSLLSKLINKCRAIVFRCDKIS